MSLKGSRTTADYLDFDKAVTTGMKLLNDESAKVFGLYIILSANTGLRASDVLTLMWSQLDSAQIDIRESKTGKHRRITLNGYVKDAIEKFRPRKTGYVFANKDGVPYTIQHINRVLKRIFAKEAMKLNISTHSLRKAFGRRVYAVHNESEKALVYLSDLFNHSNLRITRRYLGLREEELQEVYLSL